MLYPLKFRPRLKKRMWGGESLIVKKGKGLRVDRLQKYGESWDLSGVEDDLSVVANGPLKGNNIQELTEVYMGDLVGEKVFDRYGLEFPLLFKTIDAKDKLSIQVHPGDDLAAERHHSFGKTEMWYISEAHPGAELYIGFNRPVSREEYIEAVATGHLCELLNRYEVRQGDAFIIPAGTIHAIGAGIELIEIQQASDVTYRVYDWDRIDSDGKPRELHMALAVDAIDFGAEVKYDITRKPQVNGAVRLVGGKHFTVNLIEVDREYVRDLAALDSFAVYVCVSGQIVLSASGSNEHLEEDDLVMIPAEENEVTFTGKGRLLEVYIE